MLNMNYSECQKCLHIATGKVFIFQQNSTQLVGPHYQNKRTMLMHLTEQAAVNQQ